MTSHHDEANEGKGRVHPGPSPSNVSSPMPSTHRSGALTPLLGTAVVLVAGVAATVFGTQAHQHSSPAALALVWALGSYLGVVLVAGIPRARSRAVLEWLPQALVGAGGLALAPWLVLANRYTDAPPGSEVVFFSVAAWGAMLALALAAEAPDRTTRAGGAVLALAGVAGVVANWERPSSFSPLVRFAREESFMLLAGVLWVALVVVLLRAALRGALPAAALRASLGGIAAALVLAGTSLAEGTLVADDFGGAGVWAFGISAAFLMAGSLVSLRSRSAFGIAAAHLLVPATMTLLLLFEEVFGIRGPNPLLAGPIAAGTASTMAGLWLTRASAAVEPQRACPPSAIARTLAALAVVAALVAMALPGMTATVTANRADASRFAASFTLHGFEIAGTWLALGVAVAALGIALRPRSMRQAWSRAAALAAAIAAWPFVAATPVKTLTSFIPSDVQVDYGSEFARIDFAGSPPLFALAALGGALLAVAVTLFACRSSSHGVPKSAERDDREVAPS